jgi:hypothetical protein
MGRACMSEMLADVATLKEQARTSNKRIEILEESVKMMPKMETLLEITIETNKKQTDTLNNINTNLTMLNNNYDNLTHRVGTIENDLKSSGSNSSININKLATETISKIIPSILGGLILAWLYFNFGLK